MGRSLGARGWWLQGFPGADSQSPSLVVVRAYWVLRWVQDPRCSKATGLAPWLGAAPRVKPCWACRGQQPSPPSASRGSFSHLCLPRRSVLGLPSQAPRWGNDLPSISLLSLLRTLAIGCGPTLIIQNDLISRALTSLHLQRPFVLIRAHSQGPGCGPIFWGLLFTPPHPWCVALSGTRLLRTTACGVPGWPQPGWRAALCGGLSHSHCPARSQMGVQPPEGPGVSAAGHVHSLLSERSQRVTERPVGRARCPAEGLASHGSKDRPSGGTGGSEGQYGSRRWPGWGKSKPFGRGASYILRTFS